MQLTANLDRIGAAPSPIVPGRHEPGTGEINYRFVLRQVAEAGCAGFGG